MTTTATKKWTINAIQAAVRATGSHWFDPDTMRFFGTKVRPTVYAGPGGVFFVTGEWDGFDGKDKGVRTYTIRQFDPTDAGISTVGKINQYRDPKDAEDLAAKLAFGGDPTATLAVGNEEHKPISEAEQFLADCRQHGKPDVTARDCRELCSTSKTHTALMVARCNGEGPTDRTVEKCRDKIRAQAAKVGAVGVHFGGDPRGCTVKLVWADGECNDWGKEGWCVPGA